MSYFAVTYTLITFNPGFLVPTSGCMSFQTAPDLFEQKLISLPHLVARLIQSLQLHLFEYY